MDVRFLENVIQKSIEVCEQYVSLLKTLKRKCNEQDIQFIIEKCATLRSNEKLISLNRSILEETVSSVDEPRNRSIESGNASTDSAGSEVARVDEEEIEEKYRPNGNLFHSYRTPFHVENFINLAEQRVSFKQAVTVVHFSNDMEEVPVVQPSFKPLTGEPSPVPSASATSSVGRSSMEPSSSSMESSSMESSSMEHSSMPSAVGSSSKGSKGETRKSAPKKNVLLLAPAYVRRIRDGRIDFQRHLKRTVGLCFFCDERKTFTKLQWQKHLLQHTNESLYVCKQCGHTSQQRNRHNACTAAQMTDIYDQYGCIGENSLAAFICNVCNYVQVNENRMVEHLNISHNIKGDFKQSYKKCNFVTNV